MVKHCHNANLSTSFLIRACWVTVNILCTARKWNSHCWRVVLVAVVEQTSTSPTAGEPVVKLIQCSGGGPPYCTVWQLYYTMMIWCLSINCTEKKPTSIYYAISLTKDEILPWITHSYMVLFELHMLTYFFSSLGSTSIFPIYFLHRFKTKRNIIYSSKPGNKQTSSLIAAMQTLMIMVNLKWWYNQWKLLTLSHWFEVINTI